MQSKSYLRNQQVAGRWTFEQRADAVCWIFLAAFACYIGAHLIVWMWR